MRWAFTTTDVSPSRATHGKSRRGMAPLGKAWHGLDSSGRGAFTGATPRRCLPLLGAWHGMARSGWDRHGVVWHGSPRYGTTSWCAAGFDSLPLSPPLWGQGLASFGGAWPGVAGSGTAGRCKAGRGLRRQHGGASVSPCCSHKEQSWHGAAGRGVTWQGEETVPWWAWAGPIPADCLAPSGAHGLVWQGMARHGAVGHAKARQGTPLRRGHNT